MAEMPEIGEGFEREIEAALEKLARGAEPGGPAGLHPSAAISSRIQELASSEMEVRTSPPEGARRAAPQPEDDPELSWAYRQQLQRAPSRSLPFLAAALGAIAGSVATLLAVGAALSFLGERQPEAGKADVAAVQAPAPPPRVEPKPPRPAAKREDIDEGGELPLDDETVSELDAGARRRTVFIPPPVAHLPETLSEAEILRVVLLHKPAIVACVTDSGDEVVPGTKRTLTMRWTIERDGRTSGVAVATAGLESSPVGACLADEIATWRFPRHSEPQPLIRFPFTY